MQIIDLTQFYGIAITLAVDSAVKDNPGVGDRYVGVGDVAVLDVLGAVETQLAADYVGFWDSPRRRFRIANLKRKYFF